MYKLYLNGKFDSIAEHTDFKVLYQFALKGMRHDIGKSGYHGRYNNTMVRIENHSGEIVATIYVSTLVIAVKNFRTDREVLIRRV